MPTYATTTPRNFSSPKPFIVYRVFGPGRTTQIDAAATKVEATSVMDSQLAAVSPSELAAFIVMKAGKMVASVGLPEVLGLQAAA